MRDLSHTYGKVAKRLVMGERAPDRRLAGHIVEDVTAELVAAHKAGEEAARAEMKARYRGEALAILRGFGATIAARILDVEREP